MTRSTTVTMTKTGDLHMPASIRRMYPEGGVFSLVSNNGKIVLEPKTPPPPKTREEAVRRFMAASEAIARDFEARGITEADIRKTIKRLRAERRAQSGSHA